jgi:hypothetical protein
MQMIEQLAKVSKTLLPRLNPSDLSVLLHTLVRGGVHDQVLFSSAAKHIIPHLKNCPPSICSLIMPRDLAWLASSFAQAGFYHQQLFEAIAQNAVVHSGVHVGCSHSNKTGTHIPFPFL